MDEGFTSFVCGKCHTEIEASPDRVGQETECPAGGTKIIIPDNRADGVTPHGFGDDDLDSTRALKSRTIRIDLGDF